MTKKQRLNGTITLKQEIDEEDEDGDSSQKLMNVNKMLSVRKKIDDKHMIEIEEEKENEVSEKSVSVYVDSDEAFEVPEEEP